MAGRIASLIGNAVLPRRRRDFLRNEAGATAVEVGLLALPFFAILGAILETSVVFLSGQVLDSAVHDVSRLLRTGQAQNAKYTLTDFRKGVCDRLFGLYSDCDGLHIEVQTLSSFAAADIKPPIDPNCDKPECDKWTRDEVYAPGMGKEITVVQVYYKWPVILNLAGMNLADRPGGKRLMGAVAVFSNEPFS
ncbi:TadE/TadG family type IV pilus assembly protein [Devosia sp. A449]